MCKQITNGYYRVNIGTKSYRLFIKDLKALKKLKKKVTPPIPAYDNPDIYQSQLTKRYSINTEVGSEI